MTNRWKKIGNDWCVDCAQGQFPGAVVTVTNRAGEAKTVTLGDKVAGYGFVYKVASTPRAEAAQVGDLGGVLALFAKAKSKLKFPAIVLAVPAIEQEIRLTVAGPKAKVPGSLTVTTRDKRWNPTTQEGEREWLGRVTVEGTYQPSRDANGRTEAITTSLRELAQDPAGAAKRSARLTGRCVFCNAALGGNSPDSPEGRKSLAVGYGRTCARNYGLPWGEEQFSFKAEEV